MASRAVIFFGPVSAAQREGATVQDAEEHFFTCTGDSHPNCAEQLGAYADGAGCYLPNLLHHFGVADDAELYLGAFSNGGSAVKRILMSADDRARICSVALSDATYELWADAARTTPGVAEGYVAFALDALDGSKLFLATASATPNNVGGDQQPSGSQTLAELATEIGRRSGQPLDERTTIPGAEALDPAPVRVWTRGGVILADFGTALTHPQHVTKLAPMLWPTVVQPWAEQGLAGLGQSPAASTAPRGAPAAATGSEAGGDTAPGDGATGGAGDGGAGDGGSGAGLKEVRQASSLWTLLAWSGGIFGGLWLLYQLFGRQGDQPAWKSGT